MARKILHLDLDAFYCAVEELLDPSLRGKPIAVGGRPDKRGVIASCSYAARRHGVHSAMASARAVQVCPDLIILPRHQQEYSSKSREVMSILRDLTPAIEQLSIDEAFLDVSELPQDGLSIAVNLQAEIRKQTQLPCSLGIASNKLVAKIANDFGKANKKTGTYPNAIQEVPPGDEINFLAPLPAKMLWGVGPKTAEKLSKIGIHTIGEIASWPEADLMKRFGQNGLDLAHRAKGIDNRSVSPERVTKSFSHEITYTKDTNDLGRLRSTISRQAVAIGKSLKKSNLRGATIKIKLRWSDFTTITRQSTLPSPTNDAKLIEETAYKLFREHWKNNQPVRLIGVGVSGLQEQSQQLSLWDSPDLLKKARLDDTITGLKEKFGPSVIQKGATQKSDR